MSDVGAIGAASETLVGVLEAGITMDDVDVVLSSPADVTNVTSQTVGVFLYEVAENPHESTVEYESLGPDERRPGPLVIDLSYLLTAYKPGGSDPNQKTRRQHELLGDAMRALRDTPVVRGSRLVGPLESELRVVRGDDHDDVVELWNTFPDTSYRPSVAYSVGPVSLGAGEPESAGRVTSMTRRGGDG